MCVGVELTIDQVSRRAVNRETERRAANRARYKTDHGQFEPTPTFSDYLNHPYCYPVSHNVSPSPTTRPPISCLAAQSKLSSLH